MPFGLAAVTGNLPPIDQLQGVCSTVSTRANRGADAASSCDELIE